jgi:hypothetical protein
MAKKIEKEVNRMFIRVYKENISINHKNFVNYLKKTIPIKILKYKQ